MQKEIKLFFWTNYYKELSYIGTTAKIRAEIETLRRMGYSVYYTAYLSDGVAIFDNNDQIVVSKNYLFKSNLFLKVFRRRYLIDIARTYLQFNQFDSFLLRLNIIDGNYWKLLKEMKNQGAFVMMESLSYAPVMNVSKKQTIGFKMIYNSLQRHKNDLANVVDLMLTEGRIDDFFGISCVEFGMGVDVEKYPIHKYSGNADELNLIMVGCDSLFHGVDRILKSLDKYYMEGASLGKVKLHLVGTLMSQDLQLINSLSNIKEGDNLILYGKQFGDKLNDIFDTCNIALGPLAQFRSDKKDTGLKTKEYFARGIPYLYTGDEVHIDSKCPFIYQLNNDDSLVDISEIYEFAKSLTSIPDIQYQMRTIAKEVFSWKTIFERVLQKKDKLQKTTKS